MNKFIMAVIASQLTACSTMSESLQLGTGVGAAVGAAATYAGHSGAGSKPTIEDVGLGAGIGIGIGLITSYFTHKSVENERRDNSAYQTEIYFGDLPPSPFIVPKTNTKRGAK